MINLHISSRCKSQRDRIGMKRSMGKLFFTVTVRMKISTHAKATEQDFDEAHEVKDSKIAIKLFSKKG